MSVMSFDRTETCSRSSGFSLLEVLAVFAIMTILMTLATPAFLSILNSFSITTAGQEVRNAITLARQEATCRNRPVEVRFCRVNAQAPVKYVLLVGYEADGRLQLLSRPTKLPEGVCIDAGNNTFSNGNRLSALFNNTNSAQNATSSAFVANASSLSALPGCGSNYEVFSFFIRPDGTSNLPWSSPFPAVTIRSESGSLKNYATVQIDPANGRTTLLRP